MENPQLLTIELLNSLKPDVIFASGKTTNDVKGVYMTQHRKGDVLQWIAITGTNHDWAIYVDWEGTSLDTIAKHGDKVLSQENVRKLMPCTDEVYLRYIY